MDYSEIISNVKVYGLEESIKRAKYPMSTDVGKLNSDLTSGIASLARSERGAGHDQWLTGVIVQFDLTFTVKAWTEAQRYHFLDFISSQSTMHRITKFNLDEAYNEYVDDRIIKIMKEKVDYYNTQVALKEKYVKENKPVEATRISELLKKLYLKILYSNPAGFTLTARMTTNYRCLRNIYKQRKNHRLPEWREFCKWIETLPYAQELLIN